MPLPTICPHLGSSVECDSEDQQAQLLADLDGQGYRVRALMT